MKVAHPEQAARRHPPRGDGAVHLGSPARLPDLPRERPLRAAGHGRRGGLARGALRLRGRESPGRAEGRAATPTSPSMPSKCIVCSRCVRACDEQQGTLALTIQARGFDSTVSASQDESFMDSECVSCGACVQACPTATLSENIADRRRARPSTASRPPAPTAASAARSAPRCRARKWCAWCRTRTATPITAIPASRAALRSATRRIGPHLEADDPQARSPIRGARCRWEEAIGYAASGAQAHPERSTAATPSAASPPRAAPTRRPTWCRNWCAPASATTTSTPARACAIRPPATA